MKTNMFLLTTTLLFATNLFADAENKATKESMHSFLEHFISLKKYLVSDEEFQSPKNTEAIQTHLRELAAEVKKTKHDFTLLQENYRFSRAALEEHFVESERVFRLGNRAYARWMVNSTLGICMSCHTQVPTEGHPLSELKSAKIYSSDFDKAEFLFAIRDFDAANNLFKKIISEYPSDGVSIDKVEKSVKRQLAYSVRLKKDLTATDAIIKTSLKNKELPEFLRRNLGIWEKQVSRWKKKKLPQVAKSSPEQILAFVEKELATEAKIDHVVSAEPRLISNFVISGLLYELLMAKPDPTYNPRIMLALAMTERELGQSFFFSLANMYLRECVVRYPESSIAPRCYKEYEAEMIYSYTGSSGANLPEDVKVDLNGLKAIVDRKGKMDLQKSSP